MNNEIWLQDSRVVPLKVYQKPIVPDCDTLETLGALRQVGESFEWWRWPSRFFPKWKAGHGFEATEWAAILEVLEGWE